MSCETIWWLVHPCCGVRSGVGEIRKKLTITLLSSIWTDVACSPPSMVTLKTKGVLQPSVGEGKRGRWPIRAGVWDSPLLHGRELCLLPRFKPELWVVRWKESHSHPPSGRKGDSEHCLGVCLPDSLPFRVFCRGSERWQDGTHPPMCAHNLLPCQAPPTTDGSYSAQAPPGHIHMLGTLLAVREPGIP